MRTLTGEAGDGAGTALTGLCLYLTGQQYPRFFWFSSPESGHKNAHLLGYWPLGLEIITKKHAQVSLCWGEG